MKRVRVASLLFEHEHLGRVPGTRQVLLDDIKAQAEVLENRDLDLLVFCEGMEALGQDMEQAESLEDPGDFLQAYLDLAHHLGCVVAGSLKTRIQGRVYNSIVYVGPASEIFGVYHKVYLTLGELDLGMTPGSGPIVVETPVGRLGGLICFDLNFTEMREAYRQLSPDILVFSSMYHGGHVQNTWAYDCRCHLVSSLPFHGGGVIDPMGRDLRFTDCYNKVVVEDIDTDHVMAHLDFNQDKISEIRKKYGSQIHIDIPANLGSVMITSRSEDIKVRDVVEEFQLQLLDEYFTIARERNAGDRVGD